MSSTPAWGAVRSDAPRPCEEQAAEIERIVERDNPGRSVVLISFVNAEGHARVLLDDDTEIGWGERL